MKSEQEVLEEITRLKENIAGNNNLLRSPNITNSSKISLLKDNVQSRKNIELYQWVLEIE